MPDVPDWFLSAAGASGRNCLGITRLDFRTIYLGLRRRIDATKRHSNISSCRYESVLILLPPLVRNGLVAAKSARLRALTRNVIMSPNTEPIGMKKDPDDAQA